MTDVEQYIKSINDEVIEFRRYLHKNPEISGNEFLTQKFIKDQLNNLGLSVTEVETGLYADLIIDESFELIALRADIDALPTTELNSHLDYCSSNEGAMHACGHDGHSAILFGTIKTLLNFKENLKVNVRFIFQHDEEDKGGAKDFISAGILEPVSEIYGLHLDNSLEVSQVGIKYGQTNAGGDVFKITVKGNAAHGAYPHEGYDPIVCAAQIISSSQQIVSRNVSPLDSTVITFGKFSGGEVYNSIPEHVNIEGVIRNLNLDTQEYSFTRLSEIVNYTASAYRCDADVVRIPSYPPLYNADSLVDYFKNISSEILGCENVVEVKYPTLGLEDFAYYTHVTNACFYKLGSRETDSEGNVLNAHANNFNFNEKALYYGVLLQSNIILKHK